MHGAVCKIVKDMRRVKNPWAYGTTALELQNAETSEWHATLALNAAELTPTVKMVIPMKKGKSEGPARLVTTKGYSTTNAVSTLNALLTTNYLRRGDGIFKVVDSRRRERLFGINGSGRICHIRQIIWSEPYPCGRIGRIL